MILGFAFRSPDVVRFLIPAHKYNVCMLPDPSKPGLLERCLVEHAAKPSAGRKTVFLHKSVIAMLSALKHQKFDASKGVHIVFDAYSVLASKPIVKILDIETKTEQTWQLKRTMPGTLAKALETASQGVDESDIKALAVKIILPEDLITTDKKVGDAEKTGKMKSFLHVVQDMQSKNAGIRNDIEFWISAFYTGMLSDSKHDVETKQHIAKWSDGADINIRMFREKHDKTARARMLARSADELKRIGFDMRPALQNKILSLLDSYEYIHTMRAMFLITERNYTPEKAAHETGSNISVLTLLNRCLFDRSSIHALSRKNANKLGAIMIPKRLLNAVLGKSREDIEAERKQKQQADEPNDTTKQKRTSIAGIPIKSGFYEITALAVAAKLAPPGKTAMQVLAISKTPITTTAQKYTKAGKYVHEITKNKTEYLRFGGKKFKIVGI